MHELVFIRLSSLNIEYSIIPTWHDKKTGKTFLNPDSDKCLHYYCYFIDPHFGLGYIRIPTWLPCRLQVYINGHNWLAYQMDKHAITYTVIRKNHKKEFYRDELNPTQIKVLILLGLKERDYWPVDLPYIILQLRFNRLKWNFNFAESIINDDILLQLCRGFERVKMLYRMYIIVSRSEI